VDCPEVFEQIGCADSTERSGLPGSTFEFVLRIGKAEPDRCAQICAHLGHRRRRVHLPSKLIPDRLQLGQRRIKPRAQVRAAHSGLLRPTAQVFQIAGPLVGVTGLVGRLRVCRFLRFPRLRTYHLSHGRKIEGRSLLFPSYVFVAIVAQWHSARWCPGVIRLVMAGDTTPARVPDAVIAEIRAREVRGLVELPKPPRFKPGDRVRVLHGPFVGLVGLYAGMKPRERVELLLAILGGSQRFTLAADAVEAAL
jgi:transcriptional antiterminator RfaH